LLQINNNIVLESDVINDCNFNGSKELN
jgi:hypothetical protein